MSVENGDGPSFAVLDDDDDDGNNNAGWQWYVRGKGKIIN